MAFGFGFVACKCRKYQLDIYHIVVLDLQIRISMSNNDKSQSHFFKGMPTAFTNVFVGAMSIRHVHIFTWWTSSVAKNA